MSLSLSRAARGIAPSATLQLTAAVALMKSQGADILSLGAGEPDFDTPTHICDAAADAIEQGKTRYTDAGGIPPLRRAIADHIFQNKALRYDARAVIVCNGAKQALYGALRAILDPGDEVVLPAPYWVSYPELIRMAGGVPVPVQTTAENGFLPTARQLRDAAGARTKAILINTPGNPSGAVWPKQLLKETAQIAKEKDCCLISDEIYESLLYDGASHISPASLGEDAFGRTLLISGMSKAYAMTGWRVGYAAGPGGVITAMTAMQSHMTGNVNSIAQYAALAALQGPQDCVCDMARVFARRRQRMLDAIENEGLRVGVVPGGAFYMLLDVRPFIGGSLEGEEIPDDAAFAQALLREAHVAVVPGAPFAAPGFVRVSFAVGEDVIAQAVSRIGAFTRRLALRKSA